MRRILKWLLIVVLVAGGVSITVAAIAYWPKHAGPKYATATIGRGRVETVVNSTGKVKPVKSVSIGAFTSGPISKVYVDFNSKVKKGVDVEDYPHLGATIAGLVALPLGQGHFTSAGALFPDKTLLAEIDPKLNATMVKRDRASLNRELAELARVQAQFDESVIRKDRGEALRKVNENYISREELDERRFKYLTNKAQVELAKATVEQAQATLENSEANLAYTKIWSTENGVIIERKVDPGQTVAAQFQTPELFTIGADMDKQMHVFGSVDEADIGLVTTSFEKQEKLAKSTSVTFTVDAYPGELFHGKIFQIRNNSTTEQNVVTYPVVIEAPNPGGKLRPNMTATITFKIEAKEDVPRLPVAAIRFVPAASQVRPEDRHYVEASSATASAKRSVTEKVEMAQSRRNRIVWVQDGEFLKAVRVTLGLIDRQYAELVGGDLKEGENVVVNIDTTTPR
jgi:HlyD family secretion protein